MATRTPRRQYRPTESKYKGGAQEFYLTYDLEQPTRGGGTAVYPRVKRVYLSGDVRDWAVGRFTKKSGKSVHGVRIAYEQTRGGYHRRGYRAHLGRTAYTVPPTTVKEARQTFVQVIEVPEAARNVGFHAGNLPGRYRAALQDVR